MEGWVAEHWVRDAHSAGVVGCWSHCPDLFMCPISVGACEAGGQGPAFMGLLFLWGWMWQREWHPGCLPEELVPHGARVSGRWGPQSPGRGGLRQGVQRKDVTWQVGGTAGRPACLRTVSRGMGGSWSPGNGQWTWKWDGSLGWSRAEERYDLMWELRESSDGHWRGDSRSNSKSVNWEDTSVGSGSSIRF